MGQRDPWHRIKKKKKVAIAAGGEKRGRGVPQKGRKGSEEAEQNFLVGALCILFSSHAALTCAVGKLGGGGGESGSEECEGKWVSCFGYPGKSERGLMGFKRWLKRSMIKFRTKRDLDRLNYNRYSLFSFTSLLISFKVGYLLVDLILSVLLSLLLLLLYDVTHWKWYGKTTTTMAKWSKVNSKRTH